MDDADLSSAWPQEGCLDFELKTSFPCSLGSLEMQVKKGGSAGKEKKQIMSCGLDSQFKSGLTSLNTTPKGEILSRPITRTFKSYKLKSNFLL